MKEKGFFFPSLITPRIVKASTERHCSVISAFGFPFMSQNVLALKRAVRMMHPKFWRENYLCSWLRGLV